MSFSSDYMARLSLLLQSLPANDFERAVALLRGARQQRRKVLVAGNGGSAAMASHVAVDFTKVNGLRAVTFNEADLITCFANDFGYEQWIAKALEFYADAGDIVLLISSSGRSPNIVAAARYAVEKGLALVTFTGFAPDNPVRGLGTINFWVDCSQYNLVEATHQAWALALVDALATD